MNEKTLEKITKLSRRQIIELQKNVIKRKGKIGQGIGYDYSDDEVRLFLLAKFFKDCGMQYKEILAQMERYKNNKNEVLEEVIEDIKDKISFYEGILETAKKLKEDGGE
jgi:hypothetical protein